MDKYLVTIFVIGALILGALSGFVLKPAEIETITNTEYETVNNTVEVPVEVTVADASAYLEAAKDELLDYMDDEDLLECNGDEYDYDEVSISKVYNDWSISFDDDEYTVDFTVKLKFDEDDEKSCRDKFDVSAYYEEDEDVEFDID